MRKLLRVLATVLLFAPAGVSRADVAVLVHGYLGDGASWESSGVIAELSLSGGRTYHTVKQSWPVLLDLAPAQPGTTLYWLNGQPHPAIEYVSIVRNAPYGIGDGIVPAYSQDMNNLPRLRGRARSIPLSADHLLGPQDGKLLAQILASR